MALQAVTAQHLECTLVGGTEGKVKTVFHLKLATFRIESRSAQANNWNPTTVKSKTGQGVKNSKRCRQTAHWETQPRLAPCSCSAGRHHVGSRHPCASLPQHTPEQLRAASLVTAMQGSSYLPKKDDLDNTDTKKKEAHLRSLQQLLQLNI